MWHMIGRDLYNYKTEDAAYNFNYLTAYYPHKMIALSECGYSGGTSPYVSEQWDAGAKWSFAMPWYHYQYTPGGNHQYANSDWWQDWFAQDYAITMDEMKQLKEEYLSSSSVAPIVIPTPAKESEWYNLQGIRIAEPTSPGIYIRDGKKVAIRP